eukprot:scaffold797_cov408-Chaetoceros_neogracile.AAC.25
MELQESRKYSRGRNQGAYMTALHQSVSGSQYLPVYTALLRWSEAYRATCEDTTLSRFRRIRRDKKRVNSFAVANTGALYDHPNWKRITLSFVLSIKKDDQQYKDRIIAIQYLHENGDLMQMFPVQGLALRNAWDTISASSQSYIIIISTLSDLLAIQNFYWRLLALPPRDK